MNLTETMQLSLYEGMVRARYFEKRTYDLFMQGLVKGTTHLGLGQEAVAAGFAQAMRPDDMTYCTYRGPQPHTAPRCPDGTPHGRAHGQSQWHLWR